MRLGHTAAEAVGPRPTGMATDGIGTLHSMPTRSFRAMESSSIRSAGVSIRRGMRMELRTLAMVTATVATVTVASVNLVTSGRDTVPGMPLVIEFLGRLDTRTALVGAASVDSAVPELSEEEVVDFAAAASAVVEVSGVVADSAAAEVDSVVAVVEAVSMEVAAEGTAVDGLDHDNVPLLTVEQIQGIDGRRSPVDVLPASMLRA